MPAEQSLSPSPLPPVCSLIIPKACTDFRSLKSALLSSKKSRACREGWLWALAWTGLAWTVLAGWRRCHGTCQALGQGWHLHLGWSSCGSAPSVLGILCDGHHRILITAEPVWQTSFLAACGKKQDCKWEGRWVVHFLEQRLSGAGERSVDGSHVARGAESRRGLGRRTGRAQAPDNTACSSSKSGTCRESVRSDPRGNGTAREPGFAHPFVDRPAGSRQGGSGLSVASAHGLGLSGRQSVTALSHASSR